MWTGIGAEDILPNGTYQHVDGLGDGPLRRLTCIFEVQTNEINIHKCCQRSEEWDLDDLFLPAGDKREYSAVIWMLTSEVLLIITVMYGGLILIEYRTQVI